MGRQIGRSAEDTRRSILEAAAEEICTTGIQASLDQIALRAGVSKGGLKYHFPSKEDLLNALARQLLSGFRAAVTALVDPDDTTPGVRTRAYVRARLFPDPSDALAQRDLAVITMLSTVADVQELAHEDALWWETTLAGDGLPRHIYEVAMTSADGAACSAAWGSAGTDGAHTRLAEHLDRLIRSA